MYFTGNEKEVFTKMLVQELTPKKTVFWNGTNLPWRSTTANVALAEKMAEARNQDLLAEKKLRELFVIALSHDLRSPLATARMSAELLETNSENSEEVIKFAAMISRNIDRADRMILDLLDANQIRAGEKLSICVERCELRKLVSESLADLSAVYGDRFQLIVDHSADDNFENLADDSIVGYWGKSELRRVLENLCSNAVKYGFDETPIKVKLLKTQSECIIEVQNQGPLISEKDQAVVFNQHRRTNSAKAGGVKGWGLGLALVKGIAEAHCGRVAVESSEAKGTIFRVVIPLDARKEIN